jgi:hypothetical protein
MTKPFTMRAAVKAVSLVERVFMWVSWSKWLSSILTGITQQGAWQLQVPGKNGIWKRGITFVFRAADVDRSVSHIPDNKQAIQLRCDMRDGTQVTGDGRDARAGVPMRELEALRCQGNAFPSQP